jgi:hypothetical protein
MIKRRPQRLKKWEPIIEGNHLLIPLTQGRFALIDPEDFNKIKNYKWSLLDQKNGIFYATTNLLPDEGRKTTIRMHRLILETKKMVDHINGDGLDNRKNNLRVCTRQENAFNSKKFNTNKSGYKGVCWHKQAKKWRAYIVINYRQISLGVFDTPEEAAKVYLAKAKELQGEFFPSQKLNKEFACAG